MSEGGTLEEVQLAVHEMRCKEPTMDDFCGFGKPMPDARTKKCNLHKETPATAIHSVRHNPKYSSREKPA